MNFEFAFSFFAFFLSFLQTFLYLSLLVSAYLIISCTLPTCLSHHTVIKLITAALRRRLVS